MSTNTAIPSLDGQATIPAYVSRPAGTPRAAIIVYQEIFGVNPGICKKADDWSSIGYLAVAPDVFWRQEPGIELDPDVPEQLQSAFGYMQGHDFFKGLHDVEAVIHWIRREQHVEKSASPASAWAARSPTKLRHAPTSMLPLAIMAS